MTALHADPAFASTDDVNAALTTFALTELRPGVADAVARLRSGGSIVVQDHEGGPADMVFAAQFATPELIVDMLQHTSGFICAAMTGERAESMGLPLQHRTFTATGTPRYCVSVDASEGISTGISAHDRARTLRLLADPGTRPDEFTRPGHVVPATVDLLRAAQQTGAELRMTVAAVLCLAAGLRPVVATAGLLSEIDRELAGSDPVAALPAVPVVSVTDVRLS